MHRVIIPLFGLLLVLMFHLGTSYVANGWPQTSSTSLEVTSSSPEESLGRLPVDVTRVPIPKEAKYRLPAEARVRFVEAQVVPLLCGAPEIPTIIACVDDIGGSVITLPNPCSPEFIGEDFAAVVCHEKGHILGWRHDMPSVFPSPERLTLP